MDNATPGMAEQLVLYMDGALSAAEKQAVEERLGTDAAFRAEYESLLQARAAIKLYGLKQQVGAVHKQMMDEMTPAVRRINPARKTFRYAMAVAASLVILIGGYMAYNFFTLSPDKVYSAHYHSYTLVNERGADSTGLTAEEKAYAEKKYKEVVRLHDEAAAPSVKEEFLCGTASMELGDDTKAIRCFNRVLELNQQNNRKTLNDETEYYLALSYIRNKDYDFALPLLEKIRDDNAHTYHNEVTSRLVRKVRMLKWR
ncbi:MAG: hypothetical protein U0U70_05005 [Chitinophagaceae bacterium]